MPAPIVLWSHPRSVSTAFTRAILTRDDFHVLHEPYSEPCYYNAQECLFERYAKRESNTTYADITRAILTPPPGKTNFAKDMAGVGGACGRPR